FVFGQQHAHELYHVEVIVDLIAVSVAPHQPTLQTMQSKTSWWVEMLNRRHDTPQLVAGSTRHSGYCRPKRLNVGGADRLHNGVPQRVLATLLLPHHLPELLMGHRGPRHDPQCVSSSFLGT